MSIARHHAEWLSLMEISGPFLSMPVLLEAFPQGLDADDPDHVQQLRAAYEEWADNQGGLTPEPAIHRAWLDFVLQQSLGLPTDVLAEGQAIPESIKATLPEHGETIRPDRMVVDPDSHKPQLLIQTYPVVQDLNKAVPGLPWKASPATRMMELLHSTEIRLGLVTNGEQWLLVQAKRGETTGYISWYAGLWLEERLTLRAFRSLLGVSRFFGVPEAQTLPAMLDASAKDQHEVTDQLGYQVRRAVEILVQAIDRADQDRGRTLLIGVTEERLYEAALTVMMRLVFLLSAEERGLLLLGDPIYDQYYAISTLRAQLRSQADQHGEEVLERGFDAWSRLLATFRVVFGGVHHENMNLPAYGGSLFDPDRFPFLEGRRGGHRLPINGAPSETGSPMTGHRSPMTDPLPINNRTTLHLLEALQILQVKVPGGGSRGGSLAEARRLSFRALDIEQIGHVYEGLLDHEATRATEPVLGLAGTQNKEPEVPLAQLENLVHGNRLAVNGNPWADVAETQLDKLLDFLQEETGRSRSALRNSLTADNHTPMTDNRLRIACGNNDVLYRRVLPWAGLVREDDYAYPVVIPADSVYVTAGTTRRATGTHYTPRSLTEPIVQHTLEPLVYIGPAEGWPREKWQLRTPAEILALRVCDMAMGSGAFLVQADRYLAERLVEAWDMTGKRLTVSGNPMKTEDGLPTTGNRLQITPEGKPASGDPNETILPDNDEERLVLARRLVADRCLYGVDKNHLAVEMAKLSLWLVTLDKNRPFTFLDHALKHGDSLIGADEEMFLRWSHGLREAAMPLFEQENRRLVEEAKEKRQALQNFEVRDVRDAEEKARLLADAERATARIKLGCDLLVGARLLDDLNQSEQDALLANGLLDYVAGRDWQDPVAARAVKVAQVLPAFHWHFEFPEVFAAGGFSAFVGNPPFIGGKRIREQLGDSYRATLSYFYSGSSGNADLSAFFFLHGYRLLSKHGTLGLIATNTIAQGDTRRTGLDSIAKSGGTFFRAVNDQPWPGEAAVVVNIVHIAKMNIKPPFWLDGNFVERITSLLDTQEFIGQPKNLRQNDDKSHIGTYVLGLGFLLEPNDAHKLINKDNKNSEVLFPYLVGQDLNSHPEQKPSRWIINFFTWSLNEAETYPDCMEIVRKHVYPERIKKKGIYSRKWWQYGRPREHLYETIRPLRRILVLTIVSKTVAFAFVDPGLVYAHRLVVFAYEDAEYFAVLQSSFHYHWAWKYSSTLKQDLNYSPTDVFQTYPFPQITSRNRNSLNLVGEKYHEHRRLLMLERQEGLTATYNRFHDQEEMANDIAHLRQLHVEMDNAVAVAYGWQDLDLGHGFHETAQGVRYTISEPARREVLTRLLQLNHQRYEEEVKLGLHDKKSKKPKAKNKPKKTPKKNDGQLSLF
ncbi:MAG: restriction endonuclease [Anaerolineae bacterium]|nr:restriction endonuclease [Anaerolineae bacterium]